MPGYNGNDRTLAVSREAAYWYILCTDDDTGMLRADRNEFTRWIRRSPENIAELFKIARLDGKLRQVRLVLRSFGLAAPNVIELATGAMWLRRPADDNAPAPAGTKVNGNSSIGFKIAMAVILTMAVLLGVVARDNWSDRIVHTGPSQRQHMTLEDGSVVHVSANTKLKVDFSAERRTVHLIRGEAAFEVAKNPKRPFTVTTDIVDVTAVGTRFGVAIDPGVTATVSEGVVKVTPHGQLDAVNPAMLRAGDQLHAPAVDVEPELERVDADRKLAWVNGEFRFDGEMLSEAARAFNRQNSVQIEIAPQYQTHHLGLYRFDVNDPQSFVETVAAELHANVVKEEGIRSVLRLQPE